VATKPSRCWSTTRFMSGVRIPIDLLPSYSEAGIDPIYPAYSRGGDGQTTAASQADVDVGSAQDRPRSAVHPFYTRLRPISPRSFRKGFAPTGIRASLCASTTQPFGRGDSCPFASSECEARCA
jgi:hypothetical protein